MRRTLTAVAAAAATTLALGGAALPATATASTGSTASSAAAGTTGDYIVVLDDSLSARTVAQQHADRFGLELGHVYTTALQGYSTSMPAGTASLVAALPGVQSVQRDTPVQATAQTTPTGINRSEADLSPTARIDGVDQRVNVDVAVIDTGVDLDHPDLNVYRAGAKNCALIGLGADDDHGHGSHVAGTIGALDNASGVVGMAPGARIWPVKVLNALRQRRSTRTSSAASTTSPPTPTRSRSPT